jgi:hypothetical protein
MAGIVGSKPLAAAATSKEQGAADVKTAQSSISSNSNSAEAAVLKGILANNRKSHAQIGGYLSNHCSMTTQSLHSIGAPAKRIRAWFASEFEHARDPLQHTHNVTITRKNYEEYLGKPQLNYNYVQFFESELARLKNDHVALLQLYYPRLAGGVVLGLFHPLIRLDFALVHPSPGLHVADSLAYAAIRYTHTLFAPQPVAAELKQSLSPLQIMQTFATSHKDKAQLSGYGSNFDKVFFWMQNKAFRAQALGKLALHDKKQTAQALRGVAEAALHLYGTSPSLFALHGVTASHAMFDVVPLLPLAAQQHMIQLFVTWLCALYVNKQTPALPYDASKDTETHHKGKAVPIGKLDWPALKKQSYSQREQHTHVVKMIYSSFVLASKLNAANAPLYKHVCNRIIAQHRPW